MTKRSAVRKLLVLAGLQIVAGLVLFISGVSPSATFIYLGCFTLILWWFTRKPRPQNEQPCSSVSCCHYLEDDKYNHPPVVEPPE